MRFFKDYSNHELTSMLKDTITGELQTSKSYSSRGWFPELTYENVEEEILYRMSVAGAMETLEIRQPFFMKAGDKFFYDTKKYMITNFNSTTVDSCGSTHRFNCVCLDNGDLAYIHPHSFVKLTKE